VVITSQRDKDALEALARRYLPDDATPAPITVVTNGVDLAYFHPPQTRNPKPQTPNPKLPTRNPKLPTCNPKLPTRNPKPATQNPKPQTRNPKLATQTPTIVFTGKMSYHANIAAVRYFAEDVLPHIWAEKPEARFQIVGKEPPEAVRQLAADERIEVTGYVDDLRPYLAQATVAVCPALYAVGIQNKVLEAMAMGAPVVSTPAGCAALATEEGKEILTAEQEEDMASAVLRVLSEPGLARQLSEAGREYVETHHSWAGRAKRLVEIYQQARA
jgi:glycosyltransferase involved in cell wall biosynthesis